MYPTGYTPCCPTATQLRPQIYIRCRGGRFAFDRERLQESSEFFRQKVSSDLDIVLSDQKENLRRFQTFLHPTRQTNWASFEILIKMYIFGTKYSIGTLAQVCLLETCERLSCASFPEWKYVVQMTFPIDVLCLDQTTAEKNALSQRLNLGIRQSMKRKRRQNTLKRRNPVPLLGQLKRAILQVFLRAGLTQSQLKALPAPFREQVSELKGFQG